MLKKIVSAFLFAFGLVSIVFGMEESSFEKAGLKHVYSFASSRNQKKAFHCSDNNICAVVGNRDFVVQLWDIQRREIIKAWNLKEIWYRIVVGRYPSIVTDTTDLKSAMSPFGGFCKRVLFHPDDKLLLVTEAYIIILDIDDSDAEPVVIPLFSGSLDSLSGYVTVCYSLKNPHLLWLFGSLKREIVFCDLQNGQVRKEHFRFGEGAPKYLSNAFLYEQDPFKAAIHTMHADFFVFDMQRERFRRNITEGHKIIASCKVPGSDDFIHLKRNGKDSELIFPEDMMYEGRIAMIRSWIKKFPWSWRTRQTLYVVDCQQRKIVDTIEECFNLCVNPVQNHLVLGNFGSFEGKCALYNIDTGYYVFNVDLAMCDSVWSTDGSRFLCSFLFLGKFSNNHLWVGDLSWFDLDPDIDALSERMSGLSFLDCSCVIS